MAVKAIGLICSLRADGLNLYNGYFSMSMKLDPYGNNIDICGSLTVKVKIVSFNTTYKKSHAWGACFGVSNKKLQQQLNIQLANPIIKKFGCSEGSECNCIYEFGPVSTAMPIGFHMFQFGGGTRGDNQKVGCRFPLLWDR